MRTDDRKNKMEIGRGRTDGDEGGRNRFEGEKG